MLWLVALLLVAAMAATRGSKGPVWAFAIAWLFCMSPMLFGWIVYGFFDDRAAWYFAALLAMLACYIGGAGLWLALPRAPIRRPSEPKVIAAFVEGHTYARIAWWAGIMGVACVSIDFFISGGAGLDDLAALRDTIVERTSVSTLAQIGSVLTWGCLYSFIFAVIFRARLTRAEFVRMLVPIAGYFLLSVFSAGRQAAFQILLVTLFAVLLGRARRDPAAERPARSRGTVIGVATVATLMIAYMGYVAVARNDNAIDVDKARVITALFEANVDNRLDAALSSFGSGFHSAAIEGMIYFSSPVALFQKFLAIDFPDRSIGGLTFPFVFRQLQGLTGIHPGDVLADKIVRLSETGVIGAGWTTAISSYLEDFGSVGAGIFLGALGYYSMSAWQHARVSPDPNRVMIAIVVLLIAVYTPLLPAQSDTNIFLLWLFATGVIALHARGRKTA